MNDPVTQLRSSFKWIIEHKLERTVGGKLLRATMDMKVQGAMITNFIKGREEEYEENLEKSEKKAHYT